MQRSPRIFGLRPVSLCAVVGVTGRSLDRDSCVASKCCSCAKFDRTVGGSGTTCCQDPFDYFDNLLCCVGVAHYTLGQLYMHL
jgi:hypothetical protein